MFSPVFRLLSRWQTLSGGLHCRMLQRIAQSCLELDVSELCRLYIERRNHLCRSRQNLCKCASSSQDLSIIYLKAVNSLRFNQSDLDARSWYQRTAASMKCLQGPLFIPSLPHRSRFVPLNLVVGYFALNPAGSLFAGYYYDLRWSWR